MKLPKRLPGLGVHTWYVFHTLCCALTSIAADLCFDKCICHTSADDSIALICRQKNITSFPKPLPTHVTHLDLTQNALTQLRRQDFQYLTNLIELHVDFNMISLIEEHAFDALTQLTSLSLSFNSLTRLDGNIFYGLHLHHLNLNNNINLSHISNDVFTQASVETLSIDRCGLTNISQAFLEPLNASLIYLHWSHSIKQLTLPETIFETLHLEWLRLPNNSLVNAAFLNRTNIKHIDLSANNLQLFNLNGLINAQSINLSYNKLSSLTISSDNISNLTAVDLSHNDITSVDVSLFENLPLMRSLDISHNLITTLNKTTLPYISKLDYLDITGNPLSCDCRIVWFVHWVRLNNAGIHGGNVCPDELSILDEGHCSAPDVYRMHKEDKKNGFLVTCLVSGVPVPAITWTVSTKENSYMTKSSDIVNGDGHITSSVYINETYLMEECFDVPGFSNMFLHESILNSP